MPAPAQRGKAAAENPPGENCVMAVSRCFAALANYRMLLRRRRDAGKLRTEDDAMRMPWAVVSAVVIFLLTQFALAQQASDRVVGLMKSVVIPGSDVVFAVGKAAPKSDKEWAAVESAAAKLTDAGKALASEAPATGGANWIKLSNAMSEAAAGAGRAAKNKNVDAVMDAGDALYTTCDDCHRQYMKK
jgi:hypothetical protein